MQTFIKETGVIKRIKATRIKWCGLRNRLEGIEIFKKICVWNPIRMRAEDELINDFKEKKLRNWSQIMKDGEAWNDKVQRPKPMLGCSVRRKRRYTFILTVPITIQSVYSKPVFHVCLSIISVLLSVYMN